MTECHASWIDRSHHLLFSCKFTVSPQQIVPEHVVWLGGSEAARERALNSAEANERRSGRSSMFPR
jgi:hypothetical protein